MFDDKKRVRRNNTVAGLMKCWYVYTDEEQRCLLDKFSVLSETSFYISNSLKRSVFGS